ncbi:MAG: hypothetical protein OEY34_00630 [Cyclobacteriaceae bacterium]|nr:hypothetical protein [Cyclobacteriaceae bacterium]
MDKLKDHINSNRKEFDIYKTDTDSLWNSISEELEKREKKSPWLGYLARAASISLIVMVSIYLFLSIRSNNDVSGYALHDVSEEMAETEYFYTTLIEEKMSYIKASNADLDPLVFSDIAMLDSAYRDLKMDLKEGADNEDVVMAMIENYRLKLAILERILDKISKNEGDDKIENSSI